jgi:hypothetical protein
MQVRTPVFTQLEEILVCFSSIEYAGITILEKIMA